MKIDGGCHCGAITYEAEIDPEKVVICHCTDCQALSGSAFRTVVLTAAENFKLLSGTPKTYVKTAQSGNKRAQVFCPDCGAHLYAGPVETGTGMLGLRGGTIRQRAELVPKTQVWGASALPWLKDLASVPVK